MSLPMCKFKEKLSLLFLILFVSLTAIYLWLNRLQESYHAQSSEERCLSELTSVKYQLNVVTEYKNRIDKLLLESQKAHEADKERLKEFMESCVAMKQQSSICQNQFEDLQGECKRVKEGFDVVSKELKLIKSSRQTV